MLSIPEWVKKIVKTCDCPYCGSRQKNNIESTSFGIKENSDSNNSIFLETKCSDCKKLFTINIQKKLLNIPKKEIVSDLLRSFVRNIYFSNGTHSKSKITTKEVDDFKKFMNQAKTFDEILIAIGVPKDQILSKKDQSKKDENS